MDGHSHSLHISPLILWRGAHSVFPRLQEKARALREAYRVLADDLHHGHFVTIGAEWLFDNFHLVSSEIAQIRRNLPPTYYRELPALAVRTHARQVRIYAVAVELIRHSDSRLDA